MTPEQKKALALAAARRRRAEAEGTLPTFDQAGFARQRADELMGPGQAALQGAAQGVSFGAADEAQGLLQGLVSAATDWGRGGSVMDEDPGFLGRARNRFNDGYEHGRDTSRIALSAAREAHPVASTAGEVLGAVAMPGAALGAAKDLNTLQRIGLGMTTGAAMGGVYGFNAGEDGLEQRLDNAQDTALLSGTVGALTPAVGSTFGRVANWRAQRQANKRMVENAPSADTLKAQASDLYEGVRRGGPFASAQDVSAMRARALQKLQERGIVDSAGNAMPGFEAAVRPVRALDAAAKDGLDGRQVQAIKDIFSEAADSPQRTRAQVGQILRGEYDPFIKGISPERAQADELFSRSKKVGEIEELIQLADMEDTPNALRTKFKSLNRREIKDQLPGWTDDEIASVQGMVNPGRGERALRLAGTAAPNNIPLSIIGSSVPGYIGHALGGVPGALAAGGGAWLAGKGAQRWASSIQQRKAQIAKALAATGGRLPEAQQINPRIAEIARLLMSAAPRAGVALGQQ